MTGKIEKKKRSKCKKFYVRPYSYSLLVLKTVRNSGLLLPLPFIFSCIWQIVFSLSCKKMNTSLVFLQTYWVLLTLIVNWRIILYEETSWMSSSKFGLAKSSVLFPRVSCLKVKIQSVRYMRKWKVKVNHYFWQFLVPAKNKSMVARRTFCIYSSSFFFLFCLSSFEGL